MKPNPFVVLKNFTVPVATVGPLCRHYCVQVTRSIVMVKQFRTPMTFFSRGRFHIVSDVSDALEVLDELREDGPRGARAKAIKHCAAAAVGLVTAEEVKTAFLEATDQAGIRVSCEWLR